MRLRRFFVLGTVLLALGCSGYRAYREAQIAERNGNWDEAVLHYLELVDQYPSSIAYKSGLLRAKIKASQEHFNRAKQLHALGALEQARREYQQALQLDPSNQYARVEYEKVLDAIREGNDAASLSIEDLKRKAQEGQGGPPTLNPRSKEPISLNFPNKVNIRDIYKALGNGFGINIQYDSKLRDKQISIELDNVTAQEALEFVMRAANHFYKVLNEDTILIIEDSAQNRRENEEQVIQTFFLSNAEVKEMLTLVRSLVNSKSIASNDQLNSITLKDTADKVKVAERIIRANDKARGEVVIDVELLQINTTKLRDLGVSLSQYSVVQSLDQDPALRVSDLEFLNQQNWEISLPGFVYTFVKNSTDAQLLASPQVRISDGEQASLVIGDRVPIPVTTFNSAQTVGGNIVPITSFQYQDIGIRLEIEPRIHHNREISLNIQVEVANVAGFVEGSGGQQQPIIGTRNIQSTIRLSDGETNFLAGLIRNDQTNTDTGVPGLSDIPVLGRFFSKKSTDKRRTDLVLTLTPHIIRTADITEEDLAPLWVGTESNLTFRGGSPRVESEVEGPFDDDVDDEEESERIRDLIRRRIQSLPQGLQEEDGGEGAPGVDLVPSAGPRSPFERDEEDDEPPSSDRGAVGLAAGVALDEDEAEALAAAAEGAQTRVSLTAERPTVGAGQEITVSLEAASSVEVSHLPMTIRFDPAALEVLSVGPGSYLGTEQEARFLVDSARPGRIVLGASRLGRRPGVTGSGVVAEVRFKALRQGSTRLFLEDLNVMSRGLQPVGPVAKEALVLTVTDEPLVTQDQLDELAEERPAGRREDIDRD